MSQPSYSYEEAVIALRNSPEYAERMRDSYLEAEVELAASRFAASAEFRELCAWAAKYRLEPGAAILDLGAGNGIASFAWAGAGFRVTALDPGASVEVGCGATRKLSRIGKLPIQVVRGVGEQIPCPARRFDLVYVRQALHHAGDLPQMLREIARVLKPGGLLFATREHVVSDRQELELFLERHPLHQLTGGEMAYSLPEYRQAIVGAGLRLLRVFQPLDTVVNYFPMSEAHLRRYLTESAPHRFGPWLHRWIGSLRPWHDYLRRRDAQTGHLTGPGRPFSFVARKPR